MAKGKTGAAKQRPRAPVKAVGGKGERAGVRRAAADDVLNAAAVVLTWADDPLSGFPPFPVSAPNLAGGRLPVRILDPAPPPGEYPTGTAEFRYWTAAAALSRGVDFWSRNLPPSISWRTGASLPVRLDAAPLIGGSYRRTAGIEFFHETADGRTFFACESPDLVCHELGHAILDIIRPEIFNVADIEQSAFHESFGDISALLCALQFPQVRAAVLSETGGRLRRDSRVSRFAESMGLVQNRKSPELSSAAFLRNAANEFNYKPPTMCPTSGPHTILTAQPHNFCRVFTGAFLELLDNFLAIIAPQPRERDLSEAVELAARVLVSAVMSSTPVTGYFAQVAGQAVAHAGRLNVSPALRQQFAAGASSAFVRRGILSVRSALATREPSPEVSPSDGGDGGGALRAVAVRSDWLNLCERELLVRAPVQPGGLFNARATGINVEEAVPPLGEDAAQHFLEFLLSRGQLDLGEFAGDAACLSHPRIYKTHVLVKTADGVSVQRLGFNCGCEDI